MPEEFNPSSFTRARHVDFVTRAEGEELIIEGYFVIFEQPYFMNDWEEEIVRRGAFDGCDMFDVRALCDHLSRLVLGRTIAHTLTISIDETGLYGVIRINAKDSDAVNLHARVQRGDVDQASFGFDEGEVSYINLPGGRVRREIVTITKLWEISVVTFPAYEQTFVQARDRAERDTRAARVRALKNLIERKLKHHA